MHDMKKIVSVRWLVGHYVKVLSVVQGEDFTKNAFISLEVALRSETDVFTLLPTTSMSETARVLIRTDGLIRRK